MTLSVPKTCPCDTNRPYTQCCGVYHQGAVAPDAVSLMRSRYSAYALGLMAYIRATWHKAHCPDDLEDASGPSPRWLGLRIHHSQIIDATHAQVEFTARFRVGGGAAQRMHECSRFVWEEGRWWYVDGVVA